MKLLFPLAATLLVTACATTEVAPNLDKFGDVKFVTSPQGYQMLGGVGYKFSIKEAKADVLPLCVAQVVENREVNLTGVETVTSYIPGVFRSDSKSVMVGGGQTITYVSDDRKTVIAKGVEPYVVGASFMPVERSIRYALTAKLSGELLSLSFDKLEYAQLSTGSIKNDGYKQLGAWPAAQPEKALASIKKVAENLNNCIVSN